MKNSPQNQRQEEKHQLRGTHLVRGPKQVDLSMYICMQNEMCNMPILY